VRIIPNPEKEAINRRKHRLDFSRVIEILRWPNLEEPDDRPLGYQHEARMRVYGVLDMRAVVLIYEPVEAGTASVALRPISLRYATRTEARKLWESLQ
jgi:uncharacterized DUF497 family protein